MNPHKYRGYTPEQRLCEHPHPDTGPAWFITESRWYAKMHLLDALSKQKRYMPPTRAALERMLDREADTMPVLRLLAWGIVLLTVALVALR